MAEIWQDYGALIILVAIGLIGAGAVAWVRMTSRAVEDEG